MEQHQVKDIKNKIGCIFVVHPIIFICLGKLLYYCQIFLLSLPYVKNINIKEPSSPNGLNKLFF